VATKRNVKPALVTRTALRDIRDILEWSRRKFGRAAASRYRALLIQALRDIEADPMCVGSKERSELVPGVRTYRVSFSRSRVAGEKVKAPQHFILYRSIEPGVIEIGRIIRDSVDLDRHLPEGYRQESDA
jgi:toxin ParE1/3/4